MHRYSRKSKRSFNKSTHSLRHLCSQLSSQSKSKYSLRCNPCWHKYSRRGCSQLSRQHIRLDPCNLPCMHSHCRHMSNLPCMHSHCRHMSNQPCMHSHCRHMSNQPYMQSRLMHMSNLPCWHSRFSCKNKWSNHPCNPFLRSRCRHMRNRRRSCSHRRLSKSCTRSFCVFLLFNLSHT